MGISLRSIFVEFKRRQLVSVERVPFAMVIVVAIGFEILRLFVGSNVFGDSKPCNGRLYDITYM